MLIAKISEFSGELNKMEIDISEQELVRYIKGEPVDRLFAHLSLEEQFFLKYGISKEEETQMLEESL